MKWLPEFIEQKTEDRGDIVGGKTPHRIGHHRQIQPKIMGKLEIAVIAQASIQIGGLAVAGPERVDSLADRVFADMQTRRVGKPGFTASNVFGLHVLSLPASYSAGNIA